METCRICLSQVTYTAGSLDTFQDHRSIAELITYCSGVKVKTKITKKISKFLKLSLFSGVCER